MPGFPKCCPPKVLDCGFCTEDPPPEYITLTLDNVQDGTVSFICSDCELLNTTFILQRIQTGNSSVCYWERIYYLPCPDIIPIACRFRVYIQLFGGEVFVTATIEINFDGINSTSVQYAWGSGNTDPINCEDQYNLGLYVGPFNDGYYCSNLDNLICQIN